MAVTLIRTSRVCAAVLCLVVAATTASRLFVNGVTFLGYVTPADDPSELSALIQVPML
jgi:hypothetical protein